MQNIQIESRNFPKRMLLIFVILASIIVIATSGFRSKHDIRGDENRVGRDSITSIAAFQEVYKVLTHPRCMNCHPAGNIPLQNDDSHIHTMNPKRGKDGHGLYAMKCTNCHQPENSPGVHTPPGNPKWALPPADMKMVFQNKSAHELAVQIMDYNRNGHKNEEQLLEHARDTLVKWGWTPGEGRTLPPLSYDEFVKQWDTWINTGGYAPAE